MGQLKITFGGDGEGDPRVPISNTTVKPFSADGTWTAGSWESRTSPSTNNRPHLCGRFFVVSFDVFDLIVKVMLVDVCYHDECIRMDF